ncbi:gliding motility protein GldB [Bacteroidales bacterium OttesenSCG-928-M11]|nr:gliding motility protein GldB [Bacteroidales bacterium OttesenSCG-928-M11]
MLKKLLFIFIVVFVFSSCNKRTVYGEVPAEWEIIRFDKVLYEYLTNAESSDKDLEKYSDFLDEFGRNVIKIGGVDSLGFYERLRNYFSEPTLMRLYADQQLVFSETEDLNRELAHGMTTLLNAFPEIDKPQIYMHVSGLEQNVILTDGIVSLSSDKYLGEDYPLYTYFFEDYRRALMSPDRVAPDYLLGFMMANFPFKGRQDVLLDRMIYEGKLRYLLSCLIPARENWEFVGYTKDQYDWCSRNEQNIWKQILENKHLFEPNYVVTDKYIREAPYTSSLPIESPGRVGIWIGFRIVDSYMKNHPRTTLSELIDLTDYQKLLQDSKYKP